MRLSSDMNKTVARGQSGVEVTTILSEIRYILANPESCRLTLGGQPPEVGAGSITKIVRAHPGGSTDLYEAGETRYGNGRVKINKYELVNNDSASNTTYLNIQFYRGKLAQTETVDKRSKIYYESDSAGNITACRALGYGDEHVWSRVVGAQQNIFYSGGHVGVGVVDPQHLFHVGQSPPVLVQRTCFLRTFKNLTSNRQIVK